MLSPMFKARDILISSSAAFLLQVPLDFVPAAFSGCSHLAPPCFTHPLFSPSPVIMFPLSGAFLALGLGTAEERDMLVAEALLLTEGST